MRKEKSLFARNLAWLRNQKKLTMAKASQESGVDLGSWRAWEEGRAKPRYEKLPGICRCLEYYDVLSMITTDLARADLSTMITTRDAVEGLKKVKQFLEQLKETK